MEIDSDGEALIEDARNMIKVSVKNLIERKEERDREEEGDESDWTHLVTNSTSPKLTPAESPDPQSRSIFDDVDRE